jgi:hypothetical protein
MQLPETERHTRRSGSCRSSAKSFGAGDLEPALAHERRGATQRERAAVRIGLEVLPYPKRPDNLVV